MICPVQPTLHRDLWVRPKELSVKLEVAPIDPLHRKLKFIGLSLPQSQGISRYDDSICCSALESSDRALGTFFAVGWHMDCLSSQAVRRTYLMFLNQRFESCLAADMVTLISDDGSKRRAFPIEIEVQRMSCPRCQHTFPVEFYCIQCGYVPTSREN